MKPKPLAAVSFLILWISLGLTAARAADQLPPSGFYRSALVLPAQEGVEYRFLDGSSPHTNYWLALTAPVVLQAPEGGVVSYRLQWRDSSSGEPRDVQYVVSGRLPDAPTVDPVPGTSTDAATVAVRAETGMQIWYSLQTVSLIGDGPVMSPGGFRPYDSPLLLPGAPGRVVDYRLAVYARAPDELAGPTMEYRYRIDRRNEVPAADRWVLSPVEGRFLNRQALLLDTAGLTDLRYAVDDGSFVPYTDPIIVPGTGEKRITIEGRTVLGHRTVRHEVRWQQGDTDPFAVDQLLNRFLIAPEAGGAPWRYTLHERLPNTEDPLLLQPLRIDPPSGATRAVTVRLQRGSTREAELRYAIRLVGSVPPPVQTQLWQGKVVLFGIAGARIEFAYSSEGPWTRYETPLSLGFGTEDPRVVRTRLSGGEWATNELPALPAPTDLRSAPRWRSDPQVVGSELVAAVHARPNAVVMAEISSPGGVFAAQTSSDGRLIVRLPDGLRAQHSLRFAYRDGYGNVGPWSETRTVLIDRAPPDQPQILIQDTRVRIEGSGELWYRLVGREGFVRYQGPFFLTARDGERTAFRIEAYASTSGLRSRVAAIEGVVDRREPTVPPTSTLPALGNAARPTLQLYRSAEDVEVFYEFTTDGRPAPNPTERSPRAGNEIVFEAAANQITTFNVALRARFVGGTRWSVIRRFQFVVDRVPPPEPRIESPVFGGDAAPYVVPQGITVRFGRPAAGDELWVRLDRTEPFQLYADPIVLDTPHGSRRLFVINAYTLDPAGNRTYLPVEPEILVNRMPPPPPQILVSGVDANRIVRETEALLSVRPGDQEAVELYVSVRSTEDPPAPPILFDGEPVLLRARATEPIDYLIDAYAVDRAGNRSAQKSAEVRIDPRNPPIPSDPTVRNDADGGLIWWEPSADVELFFALEGGVAAEGLTVGRFYRYEAPLRYSYDSADAGRIVFFSRSSAGVRSEVRTKRIERVEAIAAPALRGAEEGAVYNDTRLLSADGQGVIRYEVAYGGKQPGEVHELSPRFPDVLPVEAAFGQKVDVWLRARSFGGDGSVSAATDLRFEIDRVPPSAPRLSGVEHNAFYAESRVATVVAGNTDEVIYLRSWADGAQAPPFARYDGAPFELTAVFGALRSYTIEAYAMDRAGNRSQIIERWQVHFDRSMVYVDGNALAHHSTQDGTRARPFSSIAQALDLVRAGERSTILLAAGRYKAETAPLTALPAHPVAIIGGYDPATWITTTAATVIEGTVAVAGAVTLQSVEIGDLRVEPINQPAVTVLRRVHVQGSLRIAPRADVEIAEGIIRTVESQAARVRLSHSEVERMRLEAGATIVTASRVGAIGHRQALDTGPALEARGAVLTVAGSIVVGVNRPLLASLMDSDVRLEDTLLDSEAVESTMALRINGGSVVLDRSTILVRRAPFSYGLLSRGANLGVYNSVIALLPIDAGSSIEAVAITTVGGTAELAHSVVVVGARTGMRRVLAGGGSVALWNSALIGSGTTAGDSSMIALSESQLPTAAFGNWIAGWSTLLRAPPPDLGRRRVDEMITAVSALNARLGAHNVDGELAAVARAIADFDPRWVGSAERGAAAAVVIDWFGGAIRSGAPPRNTVLFPGRTDVDARGTRRPSSQSVNAGPIEPGR